ncbi:MAG: succinyl-diaminopimelate desuccinylase [Dokdonella sp.]|nr:MAG: succinyl-diaminopimelate desuccinylase [Dokdonella sp.]
MNAPEPAADTAAQVLALSRELIRRASVTPVDAGCQSLIAERLAGAGFATESLRFGEVDNLWASHGSGAPVLVFLGHTDVVPSGPVEAWSSPPFEPSERGGMLYGRGAADMKTGVAAMVVALESLVRAQRNHPGTLALLLTSDEEGAAIDGVRRVAAVLRERGQRIDACVVGEPSSRQRLGDLIRIGRRGSLTGRLRVQGVQGHVAYPELADNPLHRLAPALAELVATRWDEGNEAFPPTSFQLSNLNAGTGADNVIPGELQAVFNFRFGTASSAQALRERCEAILRRHGVRFDLQWWLSGEPFLTPDGPLRRATLAAIRAHCGVEPELSTGGGTSDGRFIAPLGAEVVELGLCNATIHKVDECVAVADLQRLPALYAALASGYLALQGAGGHAA